MKRRNMRSNSEETVDVRCGCGWSRLRCPESEAPAECPLCGLAFDKEIFVEDEAPTEIGPASRGVWIPRATASELVVRGRRPLPRDASNRAMRAFVEGGEARENPYGDLARCQGCGRETTGRHGLCSACSSVRRNGGLARNSGGVFERGGSEELHYLERRIEQGAAESDDHERVAVLKRRLGLSRDRLPLRESSDERARRLQREREREGNPSTALVSVKRPGLRPRDWDRWTPSSPESDYEQARESLGIERNHGCTCGAVRVGQPEDCVCRISRNPRPIDSRRAELPRHHEWWTRRNGSDDHGRPVDQNPNRLRRSRHPDSGACGSCPPDGRDQRGRCVGKCSECGEHGLVTGRDTVYCPSCSTCEACGCPDADGFQHYEGCALVEGPPVAASNPVAKSRRSSKKARKSSVVVTVASDGDDASVNSDVEKILEHAGIKAEVHGEKSGDSKCLCYAIPATHDPKIVAGALKKFFKGRKDVRISVK